MSKIGIYEQGWLDLVFEGRNKAYGAYQLRLQESRTTILALISGIALLLTLVGIPAAINYFKPIAQDDIISCPMDTEIKPTDVVVQIEQPKAKEPEPIIQHTETPAAAPQRTQQTVAFRDLEPTSGPITEPVLPQDQMVDVNIGSTTTAGTGETGIDIGTTSEMGGEGTGVTDGTGNGEAIIEAMLDEKPSFPGGLEKFYNKVGNAFNVPTVDKETTLRVYVSFVVEKDGSMTNIKVLKDPGYGAGKEAIRVLQSIKTKWKPGKMKGQAVRTAYNLPITLNIK